jgi:hypothetical protein
MSEEVVELEYVFVESGDSPTALNNQLPNTVLMTTGEANFTNSFLKETNSPKRYMILEESEDDS